MSTKYKLMPRLLAVLAFASLSFLPVAEAQPYGPGTGGSGNMMGDGWGMGWGMGGFGWTGLIMVCLFAIGIVVLMFRRQKL